MPVWCAYLVLYICVFMFGIAIGSFLNVCIYRYPKKGEFVKRLSLYGMWISPTLV